MTKLKPKKIILPLVVLALAVILIAHAEKEKLVRAYRAQESPRLVDRAGNTINTTSNAKGNEAIYLAALPDDFKKLLIVREDRYFYFHPGINPVSTLRAVTKRLLTGYEGGASTLTQQLVKNILGNESERTFTTKLEEAWGSF